MAVDVNAPSYKLFRRLVENGVDANEATELMNGYAHELAEKQRQHHDLGGGCELGVCHGEELPDLIDPEAP
ncbi:hypothetical protein [Streptomyces wuyuanensis]|uniref:hypothetical protein n=1 Tax=Streptomyces wuyuanensis TaxID=1196353 RepID=UPI00342F9C60